MALPFRKPATQSLTSLPTFIKPLRDVKCHSGDEATLECYVQGYPRPEVRWEKAGLPLKPSDQVLIERKGERCRLLISSASHKNEGRFTCIATNAVGSTQSSAFVLLQGAKINGLSSGSRMASKINKSKRTTSSLARHRFRPPEFFLPPSSKVVTEGDCVRFLCSVQGVPEPSVQWEKCGKVLVSGGRITISQEESINSLEIKNVRKMDAGDYWVVAENSVGKTTAQAHLEVRAISSTYTSYTAPHFIRPLTSGIALDGKPYTLSCEVIGTPTPSIRWYKKKKLIRNSADFRLTFDGQTASLTVAEIFPDDCGEYTCEAKNDSGESRTQCTVTVKDNPEILQKLVLDGEPAGFVKQLEDVEVTDGDSVTFEVQVKGTQPIEVVWVHNDQEVRSCDDFQCVAHLDSITYSLVIRDVFPEDAGLYACEVYNAFGDADTFCKLTVVEKEVEDDECDTESPECIVQEDIKNLADSSPTSGCWKWQTSAEELEFPLCRTESGKFRHRPENAGHGVESETGNVLSNGGTVEEAIISPTPHLIPAKLLSGPQSLAVLEGETVVLQACFEGCPPPTATWIKRGRIIRCDERVKVETTDGLTVLTLRNTTADDSSKYVVAVENSGGSDCHFASVSVEGPPDPPAGKPTVSNVASHSVVLSWYGSPYDGGSIITGYLVEMCSVPENQWTCLGESCHSTCYRVENLMPGIQYVFRVRAENVHGMSEPSRESDPVLLTGQQDIDSDPDFAPFKHRLVEIEDGCHFPDVYDLQEEIGRGRFGTVYRCTEKGSGEQRAAKFIRCIKAKDKKKAREEVDIMNSLRHPKLLQLAAAFNSPKEMILVMEYISGGELFERIIADDFVLTETDCILFLQQICEGIQYMHANNVIHLDLKPENILCKTKTSHKIKIIDFGLARVFNPEQPLRVLFGTPEFVAPEVVNYEPVGPPSDMWSVGVICYVLLSGLSPFMGDTDAETFANITKAEFDFDEEAFKSISDDAKDFISSLLINKAEQRLSAEQCLKHRWLVRGTQEARSIQLSTDKLKKFIIRRKWQKTGNALRALGRMVCLSGISYSHPPVGGTAYAASCGSSDTSIPTTRYSRVHSEVPGKSLFAREHDSAYFSSGSLLGDVDSFDQEQLSQECASLEENVASPRS